jgi:hypothetical protein
LQQQPPPNEDDDVRRIASDWIASFLSGGSDDPTLLRVLLSKGNRTASREYCNSTSEGILSLPLTAAGGSSRQTFHDTATIMLIKKQQQQQISHQGLASCDSAVTFHYLQ